MSIKYSKCKKDEILKKVDELKLKHKGKKLITNLIQILIDNEYIEYQYCNKIISELKNDFKKIATENEINELKNLKKLKKLEKLKYSKSNLQKKLFIYYQNKRKNKKKPIPEEVNIVMKSIFDNVAKEVLKKKTIKSIKQPFKNISPSTPMSIKTISLSEVENNNMFQTTYTNFIYNPIKEIINDNRKKLIPQIFKNLGNIDTKNLKKIIHDYGYTPVKKRVTHKSLLYLLISILSGYIISGQYNDLLDRQNFRNQLENRYNNMLNLHAIKFEEKLNNKYINKQTETQKNIDDIKQNIISLDNIIFSLKNDIDNLIKNNAGCEKVIEDINSYNNEYYAKCIPEYEQCKFESNIILESIGEEKLL